MPEVDMMDLAWNGGKMLVSWVGGKMKSSKGSSGPPNPQLLQPPPFTPPPFVGMPKPPLGPVSVTVDGFVEPTAPSQPAFALPSGIGQKTRVPLPGRDFSYSADIAQGIACAACTKDHLATMAGAAQAMEAAQDAGHPEEVRYQLARIAAEAQALQRYDWTAEKIAATPPDRLVAVNAIRPAIAQLSQQLPTPADMALAWGATDESIRFTLGHMTDRDRQEVEIRLRDVDEKIGYLERVQLSPEKASQLPADHVEHAREGLRQARHLLADDPYDKDHLRQASAQLAMVATAFTPELPAEEVQHIAESIRQAQEDFYATYFQRTD